MIVIHLHSQTPASKKSFADLTHPSFGANLPVMNTPNRRFAIILGLSLITGLGAQTSWAGGPYQFLKEIKVGGAGGWDYLSVDAAARRLYVTHATKIVVIDLDQEAVVGEIGDTPGVHGFALAPELGRGFSSNGKENQASIVDLKTLKTIAKIATGANPDAILYEPGQQEVYTFNGKGQSVTVFPAKFNGLLNSGESLTTILLPGKPEFSVFDPLANRIYCNIEDQNEVVVIDPQTHKIVATWPLAPGEEPTGLAIDLAQHRLFAGCHNQRLITLDSATGKVSSSTPIGQGVDAVAYDPSTKLVFSSNGDGTVTIAHADTPDKLTVVQTLATERGARTMALDPSTHKIYLGSAQFEPAPAGQRPQIVAGSFKVLVYAMAK